jgi:mRNA-degrading endonuclease RelE of RelBE toxin-antitoxin system
VTPPFRIHWHDAAKVDIRKLDRATAMRIFTTIEHFAASGSGDVKPLHGDVADSWRLRAGDYRMFFVIEGDTMHIGRVRHRSEAYR